MQERCVKAEREVEHLRLQLQTKVTETETAQRELAQLKFSLEKLKAALELAKSESASKEIKMRGYSELAQLNSELNNRNIEMVSKINNLQGRIDQVEAQEKAVASIKAQLAKMTTDHDTVKTQNDKLRIILKKKQMEITEMVAKHEVDLKAVQERAAETATAGATTINVAEKRDFLDAIELLKSEN